MEPWMKNMDPELLPEPYRKLCSLIGLENTLKLAEEYQGTSLYFAKLDSALKTLRDQTIRDEFRGGNYKELALKYGLTETWVRKIVSEGSDPGQLELALFVGK